MQGVFVPWMSSGLLEEHYSRPLRELLRPQFTIHLDNHIRRDVQPSRRLTDHLGAGSLVQAVGLLFVGAEKREEPLDADVGIDLRDRGDTVAS